MASLKTKLSTNDVPNVDTCKQVGRETYKVSQTQRRGSSFPFSTEERSYSRWSRANKQVALCSPVLCCHGVHKEMHLTGLPTPKVWVDRQTCLRPAAGLPEMRFQGSLLLWGSRNHLAFLGSRSLILQWLCHLILTVYTATSLSATSASQWVTVSTAALTSVSSLPQGPLDAAPGQTPLTVYTHSHL